LVALYSNVRFTDWLFMGLLFHRDYMRYPEFWRRKPGEKGEAAAVIYSVATGFLTCGIRVCRRLPLVGCEVCRMCACRGVDSEMALLRHAIFMMP
jgi:hypothetical protein